jgi:hypothetical protein
LPKRLTSFPTFWRGAFPLLAGRRCWRLLLPGHRLTWRRERRVTRRRLMKKLKHSRRRAIPRADQGAGASYEGAHQRKRSPGHWAIILDINKDGARKRKWHSFKGTKREAQAECARLITAMAEATYVETSKLTVGQHLLDRLAQWESGRKISPKTAERYRELIDNQIVPHLGDKRLQKLKAVDIEGWHNALIAGGRKDGKGGISSRTIRHAHRVLSKALREAARFEVKAPKSKAGRRDITIPDIVVEALREHRRAQLQLRVRLGLGKPSEDDLLFPTLEGTLPSPRAFSAEWADVAASIGMPDITFHALRHTHASQLIDAGVDVVTISKRLGHSGPNITLKVYAHLFHDKDDKAAEAINEALARLGYSQ